MNDLELMYEACKQAELNAESHFKEGGPFGAIIVKDGKIIGKGKNNVLASHNPTAHAEITAIEDACDNLKTHDLTGCILYTSCYPCPMCLSAIIWSNIKTIYYGNTKEDAADIGFRDDMIYNVINNILADKKDNNKNILELHQLGRSEAIKTFEKFKNNSGITY